MNFGKNQKPLKENSMIEQSCNYKKIIIKHRSDEWMGDSCKTPVTNVDLNNLFQILAMKY